MGTQHKTFNTETLVTEENRETTSRNRLKVNYKSQIRMKTN